MGFCKLKYLLAFVSLQKEERLPTSAFFNPSSAKAPSIQPMTFRNSWKALTNPSPALANGLMVRDLPGKYQQLNATHSQAEAFWASDNVDSFFGLTFKSPSLGITEPTGSTSWSPRFFQVRN